MGLSIKKDIATSLTSLIFIVILIGAFMVSFPFLELSAKKIFFLFGIVFIFSIILNFTTRTMLFTKRYFLAAAMLIAFSFFLNTPNRSTLEKISSPIEKSSIENSFMILGNNITLVKNIQSKDVKDNISL